MLVSNGRRWSNKDIKRLEELYTDFVPYRDIAKELNRTVESIRTAIYSKGIERRKVPTSRYPVYEDPLKAEGDFLVLPDLEAPYHDAEFVNRVLDLAYTWGVDKICLAGDALHYDNLSMWGADWVGDFDNKSQAAIDDLLNLMSGKAREKAQNILDKRGFWGLGSFSDEMAQAREVLHAIDSFREVYYLLGNHEDRYLRALDRALSPNELLRQVDRSNNPKWHIAPYYYMLIETERGVFRPTHPKSAAANAAIQYAIQYHQNILMAHSHRWAVQRDPSGDFWAIQMGHCVDERRLSYVAQRDAKRDAHVLGAVILRGGYPYVLSPESDWDFLKGM